MRVTGVDAGSRWMAAMMLIAVPCCDPVYAPPVRSSHDGAAGRLGRSELQLAGSGNLLGVGGIWVAVPTLQRDVKIEAGADIAHENWTIGWLGARSTWADRRRGRSSGPALDIEGGFGAGVGGRNARQDSEATPDVDEEPRWDQRIAGGGYAGVGLAWHIGGVFAPWVRARIQITGAEEVPVTIWGSAMAGIELGFYRPIHLFAGTGIAGYGNRLDDELGWNAFEGGAALHVPLQ